MIQRIVLFKLKDEYCNAAARAGLGEVVKYALIRDLAFLDRERRLLALDVLAGAHGGHGVYYVP